MSKKNNPNLTEVIKEIHDGVAREMYCNGVDDFLKALQKINEKKLANPDLALECRKCGICKNYDIEKIAEELKGGVSCVSNDVCEWELKNACYTTSIKHYYSLPTSIVKTFNNCPYCGKKIKVVE